MSPERIFNSPIKNRLRKIYAEEMQKLRKKLYHRTKSERMAKRKISTLKATLQKL